MKNHAQVEKMPRPPRCESKCQARLLTGGKASSTWSPWPPSGVQPRSGNGCNECGQSKQASLAFHGGGAPLCVVIGRKVNPKSRHTDRFCLLKQHTHQARMHRARPFVTSSGSKRPLTSLQQVLRAGAPGPTLELNTRRFLASPKNADTRDVAGALGRRGESHAKKRRRASIHSVCVSTGIKACSSCCRAKT